MSCLAVPSIVATPKEHVLSETERCVRCTISPIIFQTQRARASMNDTDNDPENRLNEANRSKSDLSGNTIRGRRGRRGPRTSVSLRFSISPAGRDLRYHQINQSTCPYGSVAVHTTEWRGPNKHKSSS